MEYRPAIGLEVHIELNTKSKMFCSCLNGADEKQPNILVCPICLGHPGTLPTINQEAVYKTIKAGLALNCSIAEQSKFDRKNYFYPDLPKGYQISQYDKPFCQNGYLKINDKPIRIRRIHLEEDTGKLIHCSDNSLIDFNRAGRPLMELVTEPDIKSSKEARQFAENLQLIMHYLDISSADMEKGQMRVEVNISLSKDNNLGTKTEIKNLNSFRSVERAVEFEIKRQTEILESGKAVVQETRGWHDRQNITISQREKEEAHDYRYFPEPDLPQLHFDKQFIDNIKKQIAELPLQRAKRFKKEYGLNENQIRNFVYNKNLGEYFEKIVSEFDSNLEKKDLSGLIELAANYLITDLQGLLKKESVKSSNFLITPKNFSQFISLIYKGDISSKTAKIILLEMFEKGSDPSHIIEEKNLSQIIDRNEIEKLAEEAINKNSKAAEDYKKGKKGAIQFLIGQIMARTKGRASPEAVKKILSDKLTKVK